jgi:hypothetical protein
MSRDDTIIPLPNINYSSQDVLNMALGTFISKQMISILKSSKSISASQIIKLFAILSLDEIRISFMDLIKKIFGILGSNYLTILWYIDKYILKNIVVRTFRYLINFLLKWGIKPILGIKNDDYKINVKFTPTLDFMKKFIKYIKPENYTIAPTHNIKLQDGNIITYKQTWLNIKIIHDNVNFNIISKMTLTFEKVDSNINLIKFNIKNEKSKSILDNNHKIELELVSTMYNENKLYQVFNNFIFFISNT